MSVFKVCVIVKMVHMHGTICTQDVQTRQDTTTIGDVSSMDDNIDTIRHCNCCDELVAGRIIEMSDHEEHFRIEVWLYKDNIGNTISSWESNQKHPD